MPNPPFSNQHHSSIVRDDTASSKRVWPSGSGPIPELRPRAVARSFGACGLWGVWSHSRSSQGSCGVGVIDLQKDRECIVRKKTPTRNGEELWIRHVPRFLRESPLSWPELFPALGSSASSLTAVGAGGQEKVNRDPLRRVVFMGGHEDHQKRSSVRMTVRKPTGGSTTSQPVKGALPGVRRPDRGSSAVASHKRGIYPWSSCLPAGISPEVEESDTCDMVGAEDGELITSGLQGLMIRSMRVGSPASETVIGCPESRVQTLGGSVKRGPKGVVATATPRIPNQSSYPCDSRKGDKPGQNGEPQVEPCGRWLEVAYAERRPPAARRGHWRRVCGEGENPEGRFQIMSTKEIRAYREECYDCGSWLSQTGIQSPEASRPRLRALSRNHRCPTRGGDRLKGPRGRRLPLVQTS